MESKLSTDRERIRKDLKNDLEYFSHMHKIELSPSETDYISRSIAYKINLGSTVFGHKGTSWIANEILRYKNTSNKIDK